MTNGMDTQTVPRKRAETSIERFNRKVENKQPIWCINTIENLTGVVGDLHVTIKEPDGDDFTLTIPSAVKYCLTHWASHVALNRSNQLRKYINRRAISILTDEDENKITEDDMLDTQEAISEINPDVPTAEALENQSNNEPFVIDDVDVRLQGIYNEYLSAKEKGSGTINGNTLRKILRQIKAQSSVFRKDDVAFIKHNFDHEKIQIWIKEYEEEQKKPS